MLSICEIDGTLFLDQHSYYFYICTYSMCLATEISLISLRKLCMAIVGLLFVSITYSVPYILNSTK